jgi:transposase
MQLQTILNHVEKHSSFVYEHVSWADEERRALQVTIRPRVGSRARCSSCGIRRRTYDRLATRRFEFVPLWGLLVFFVYAMRRVDCKRCGVTVEWVPWSDGKSPMTRSYAWFLARWAKRMSRKEVAEVFPTSWDRVYRAVRIAVDWGLKHREIESVESIGVDEILWQRGHRYRTFVYPIDAHCRRLLWVRLDRKKETLEAFFNHFGTAVAAQLRFVCSDMWKPYLDVVRERAAQPIHVLDRYPIVAKLNEALDDVRAAEVRRMKAEGSEPLLPHSRWVLLKNPWRLTKRQSEKRADLVRYNRKTMRAYLLKEEFQLLWGYVSPTWAGRYLDRWCTRALRSRIEPMKKVARTMRNHRLLILNWFLARGEISGAAVEGFNHKAKLTFRKAHGFRSFPVAEAALLHILGKLPEPEFIHEFC